MNGIQLSGLPLHICKAVIGLPMPEGMDSLKKKVPDSLPATVLAMANKISSKLNGGVDNEKENEGKSVREEAAERPKSPSHEPPATVSDEPPAVTDLEPAGPPTESEEALARMLQEQKEQEMRKQQEEMQSTVIVLKNMVTPDEVDDELRDEVGEECEKFGAVDQIIINTGETDVVIFVKFQEEKGMCGLSPMFCHHASNFHGRSSSGHTKASWSLVQWKTNSSRVVSRNFLLGAVVKKLEK